MQSGNGAGRFYTSSRGYSGSGIAYGNCVCYNENIYMHRKSHQNVSRHWKPHCKSVLSRFCTHQSQYVSPCSVFYADGPVSRNKVPPPKKSACWNEVSGRRICVVGKVSPSSQSLPRHEIESPPYGKPPLLKSLVVRIQWLSQRLKSNSNEVSCDSDCTTLYELQLVVFVLTYNLKATAW